MIFIDNKYTKYYNFIINNAKSRNLTTRKLALAALGYAEKHHITPRSVGGSNEKDNLVFLSGREHFICHCLLVKMTTGNSYEKMIFALSMMMRKAKKHNVYAIKISSKLYEKYKSIDAELKRKRYTGKSINNTLYKFCHVDGRIEICSILSMSQKYNIPRYSIAHLIKKPEGKHHVKGWSLNTPMLSSRRSELYTGQGGPNYDHKIYVFKHKTGQIEQCTKYELFTRHRLTRNGIYSICAGIQKSSQGWKIDHKSGN